jgi:hypothetical protein
MSQRKDAKITTKGKRASVRVPNATTVAGGKWIASPGDFVAFTVDASPGYSDARHGRVVGRVDAAGWDGGDKTPIKGWLCVMMLSSDLTFAHEMWIDPASVTACYSVGPGFVRFLETFFTADPMDLMRMSEYGSLGAWEHRSNALPPSNTDTEQGA